MLLNIILADAGEVSVLGAPTAPDPRARIGYLREERDSTATLESS